MTSREAVDQSLSNIPLSATPGTAACQAGKETVAG